MRFKKGNRVEVLTQKDIPSGSWRHAEIIGGNGHYYTVKYDVDVGPFGETTVQRVTRKAIRPCPPTVDLTEDWVSGDVIEVFHNYSWKMATVLMVSGWSHLLVSLLGSSVEVKAHKNDVRPRLCYQDGEWIVIRKASNVCDDMRFRVPSSLKKIDTVEDLRTKGVTESRVIPSRPLKRKLSHFRDQTEVLYPRRSEKIRSKKVDNLVCSREVIDEKFIHPSCFEMKSERKKRGRVGFSHPISLEPDDNDDDNDVSVSSSVGSCSVVYRNHSRRLHNYNDSQTQSSDAESFCQISTREELKEEIHRLELHAYRSTIEALHASGPLSWEQELLLTNLRDSLHISNDEHLTEVRNLVSPTSCIPSF